MSKLFKNVAIRWDSEYKVVRNFITFNDEIDALVEDEREIISAILINIGD